MPFRQGNRRRKYSNNSLTLKLLVFDAVQGRTGVLLCWHCVAHTRYIILHIATLGTQLPTASQSYILMRLSEHQISFHFSSARPLCRSASTASSNQNLQKQV